MKRDWREGRLGEVAEIAAGQGAPQGDHFYGADGNPFVRAGSLASLIKGITESFLEHIERSVAIEHRLRLFPKNTVVFAKSGMSATKGLVYRLKQPCYVVNHLAAVIPSVDLAPSFLVYWLSSHSPSRLIRDPAYPSVRLSDIGEIRVPLPPLPEQRRIAAILDKADAIRRKRQEAIRLIEEFLRSAFLEMFGNLFKNSRNWQLIEFGEVISLLTDYHANGSYKLLKKNVTLLNKPDYALMVRTTDLENNNFKDGVKYISRSAYEFLGKSKVFGDEIIINKIGSAGKVFLMPKLNRKTSLGMNQFMIRLTESANNIFIYYLLRSEYGEAIIQNKVQGAVTKTITKDAIRGLIIPLPPIEIQNRFARIVEWIYSIKRKMHTSMKEMEAQFDSLVQRVFRGELKSTEAELE